jgi:cell division protein FtsB
MNNSSKNIKKRALLFISKKLKFTFFSIFLVIVTIFLARHIADIFFGDNSLGVYNTLKSKEQYLQNEIRRLQADNARLQKEYFELKNLEPKE